MCCSGKQTTFTSGYPKLDQYLTGKLGQTANQYPGPVSSRINPLMTNAANMMSMYATGQPYQAPGYNTYADMPKFGDGGIAWQPQVAQIGEKGPEAIVPLRNMVGQMGTPRGPAMGGGAMPPQMQNMMGQMRGPSPMGAAQPPMQNAMQGLRGQMGQQGQSQQGGGGMSPDIMAMIQRILGSRLG